MNTIDIDELETADYDILENIKAAFYRLWKLKVVVVLATVVGFLASLIFIAVVGVRTTYNANATVYSVVYGSSEASADGMQAMNQYANTILRSNQLAERASEMLAGSGISAGKIQSMVFSGQISLRGYSTDSKKYGNVLTFVVSDSTSNQIIEIANAMAQAYADEINDLIGSRTVQVLNTASGIYATKSINVKKYILLFCAAAFVLAAGIIFVKEFFASRVYLIGQCESNEDLILGLIPESKR